jgi:hypothetical protein
MLVALPFLTSFLSLSLSLSLSSVVVWLQLWEKQTLEHFRRKEHSRENRPTGPEWSSRSPLRVLKADFSPRNVLLARTDKYDSSASFFQRILVCGQSGDHPLEDVEKGGGDHPFQVLVQF